jgi:hypothetical protein
MCLGLDGSRKVYEDIESLECSHGVRGVIQNDYAVRAIVVLDCFAKNTTPIFGAKLADFIPLFRIYTE